MTARETPIHVAIVDYLRAVLPSALVWHTPNSGKRGVVEAAVFKRMGVVAGVPDLAILTREGRLCFLEVKAEKGALSKPQEAFAAFLDSAAVPFAIVRSVEDARRALSLWGISTKEAA